MMNLDPVFSSVSLRGRNLQMTLMESSLEGSAWGPWELSLSSDISTAGRDGGHKLSSDNCLFCCGYNIQDVLEI